MTRDRVKRRQGDEMNKKQLAELQDLQTKVLKVQQGTLENVNISIAGLNSGLILLFEAYKDLQARVKKLEAKLEPKE